MSKGISRTRRSWRRRSPGCRNGAPRVDTPLLFPSSRGGYLNRNEWRRDESTPAVRAAGSSTVRPTPFGTRSRRSRSRPASASTSSPASWARPSSRSTRRMGTSSRIRSTALAWLSTPSPPTLGPRRGRSGGRSKGAATSRAVERTENPSESGRKAGRCFRLLLDYRFGRSRAGDRICLAMHDLPAAVLMTEDRGDSQRDAAGLLASAHLHLWYPLELDDVSKLGRDVLRHLLEVEARPSLSCDAARSSVSSTSPRPRRGGPSGLASVTSSRRENNAFCGPGSPLVKASSAR